MMIGMVGWRELLILLVIVVLIFGTKRLTSGMRDLGKGVREFKKGMKEDPEEPRQLGDGSEEASRRAREQDSVPPRDS